ncbi:Trafficking protein Mon1 [Nesidiocoris tenuis]|uniref:Vacuolar fusion protein MON1 homolog n=1 Tax=Nesidiocoris tenuis TaxID=355587 RepID=A0ABN7AFM2_9HEMI|nr:Trafficking protein Mon1 [Nesidiocoris tenuis]
MCDANSVLPDSKSDQGTEPSGESKNQDVSKEDDEEDAVQHKSLHSSCSTIVDEAEQNDVVNVDMMTSDLPRDLENDFVAATTELENEDSVLDSEEWKAKEKHIFILSSSGKPVYSRHGSEDKLVTLFGVMQALVSFVQDSDDTLESIHFGNNVIVFQIRGPIVLVAVSKKNDSVLFLRNMLEYVYNQVVSVLTLRQVTTIFERRRNYDLRRLLTGSERLIDHLLTFYETEPSLFMNGLACIPMPSPQREAISSVIVSTCSKIKNLVFAVLVANNRLIALARKRKYSMCPSDLHLILNMVAASESFKTAESWTPICLPQFNANGFLHGHVSYLTEDCDACLLLLTVDQDIFFQLSEAKKKITEKLTKNNLVSVINDVLKKPPSSWVSLHYIGVSKIRHFIYKCKKSQNILSSPLTPPYDTTDESRKLFTKYQNLYSKMFESNPQLQVLFQESDEERVVCLIGEKFEVLAALEPVIKKQSALDLINKLCQWIQKEEDRFFITNVPYL